MIVDIKYPHSNTSILHPLEYITIVLSSRDAGKIKVSVSDSLNKTYYAAEKYINKRKDYSFKALVGGALGNHLVKIQDKHKTIYTSYFQVDAKTCIKTKTGFYDKLYNWLEAETVPENSTSSRKFIDGKVVRSYVYWLRDDTHVKKAFKYWEKDVKSLPELFLEHQQKNGMIFDLFWPAESEACHRHVSWGKQFTKYFSDNKFCFVRIPVEADVEYLMVESTYTAWQASGDDLWMKSSLPKLEKAIRYCMSSPLRWSKKYNLIKRGFTIDTWDFQHSAIAKVHPKGNKNKFGWFDHMWIDKDTPMCIMHGDNSGVYQASCQLAKMFAYLGNKKKESFWNKKAEAIRKNTDKVCWNGKFYTHQVHIDPVPGDFGVDEKRILSLSNTYDINRDLPRHKQAVSIIKEYLSRKKEARGKWFAEWFTIHPPFKDKFGGHLEIGGYMNGGVITIVAGELAKAAFRHGYEWYGVDILKRIYSLLERDNHLHCTYHPSPKQSDWVKSKYTPLDLRSVVNRHFSGEKKDGWTGEGNNDLGRVPLGKCKFLEAEFDIINPDKNNGQGALMLKGGHLQTLPSSVTLDTINKKAKSVYFLHTSSMAKENEVIAVYNIQYADGTKLPIHIIEGIDITGWWSPKDTLKSKAAWHGKNRVWPDVGFNCFAWDNPCPDKIISSIAFESTNKGTPIILGVTFSDGPAQFPWGNVSSGIPDNWGSAAVVSAMIEGLAGVTDNIKLFEDVGISPRWVSAGEDQAFVLVRYGASNGYVAYEIKNHLKSRKLSLSFAGSGNNFRFHVMLPKNCKAREIVKDGEKIKFKNVKVEKSHYVDFNIENICGGNIVISLKKA